MTLHPLSDLGACRPHTRQVAEEFVGRFPILQSWAYNPASHGEHGEGRALDLMVFIDQAQNIGAKGKELGDRIFDAMWRDRARLGVEYIIWNRHIINTLPQFQPGVLRPYNGPNPHTDHVHTTFLEKPPTYQPVSKPPAVPVVVPTPKPPTLEETPMRRDPFYQGTSDKTGPQKLKPGTWTRIRMADGQVALNRSDILPCVFAYDAGLAIDGVTAGTQIQLRTYTSKVTGDGDDTKDRTGYAPAREFVATNGTNYVSWSQVAQELDVGEYLRVEVLVYAPVAATVTKAQSKALYWKGA